MDRGQAHTLEGVIAGLVLLSGLVFALQATAVTPLSASTSSQQITNQLQASAGGVLAAAADKPTDGPSMLKRAVLFWGDRGDDTDAFRGADNEDFYTSDTPSNQFGDLLRRTFDDQGIAYNVYVVYQRTDGSQVRQRMIYRGDPSDNAVTASRLVTLYDDDELYADNNPEDGVAESTGIGIKDSNFYAPDVARPNVVVHNLVEVEVVVWRM